MNKRLSDIIKLIIFLSIGLFFIYWFLLKLEPNQKEAIWDAFRQANYWWVLLFIVCNMLSHLVRALRWRLLYRPLNYNPNITNTFGSVIVAYMANLAFPRLGEVARCATMRTSEQIPMETSIGTVVTERIIDALSFLIITVLGVVIMSGEIEELVNNKISDGQVAMSNIPVVGIIVAGVVLLILLVIAYKLYWGKLMRFKIVQKIDKLIRGCMDGITSVLHLGKRRAWLFVIYSIIIPLLYIAGGVIVFQAFGESRGMGMTAAFVVYLFGTVGMTFSQGGLGVYPVMVQLALALYNISVATGTAVGWMMWGAQQVGILAIGMIFLAYFALVRHHNAKEQGQTANTDNNENKYIMETQHTRCLIIGSGPAGYTAGIYTGRADLHPLLYAGLQPGGQLTITTEVENFPGYPQGVDGTALMEDLRNQAMRFGTEVRDGAIMSIDLSRRPFHAIDDQDRHIEAESVIIATGASARWLGLESEQRFYGNGVSACATCDGFFYRNKVVAVVGGGDTACEEACYLATLCSKVYQIVRRDQLRASKAMQHKVLNNPKIEVLWNSVTDEIVGDDMNGVNGMVLRNVKTNETTTYPISGFFVAIGHQPNTSFLNGQLELNETGYIKVQDPSSQTSVEGVFAAGDVCDPNYRQAVVAAGKGCIAAMDVERFLNK